MKIDTEEEPDRNTTPVFKSDLTGTDSKVWQPHERFVLRVTAIFVVQLCIPLNRGFYDRVFHINPATLNWQSLSGFTGVSVPDYIDVGNDIWSFYSYINLAAALGISIALAGIWSIFSKRKEYNLLYYRTRVIARYSAAYGILAWGMKKFIPKQMELPSITFLETPFADFSEQKIYWQSVGIAQNYEIFLGFAEILAGVLLLFRKTTAPGAALLAVILFNICIANHAYDGMVHVVSMTYAILGVIILWYYLPGILQLLINKHDVFPAYFTPEFPGWQGPLRYALKYIVSFIFLFYSLYLHSVDAIGYRYPHNYPGLTNSAGVYEVAEFRLNNKTIPFSPLDSVRWQDAIFENWSTLTFKVNRTQHMDNENTGREGKESIDKRFEFRGIGGGRIYFDYKTDTLKRMLYLVNKNKAHKAQTQILHYARPSASRIILSGLNEFKDSIYVVLDRKNKKYALFDFGITKSAGREIPFNHFSDK